MWLTLHPPFILRRDNTFRMSRLCGTSYMPRRMLLLTAVALCLTWCSTARADDGGGQPAHPSRPNHPERYTGIYKVLIRGYWTGEGRATVTDKYVELGPIQVKDDSGHSATLTMGKMPLANRRFTGTGTVTGTGTSITIEGRVEPADDHDTGASEPSKSHPHGSDDVLTNARFGATYITSGNHGGRLSGGRDLSGG